MNKERRKRLAEAMTNLGIAFDIVCSVREDEQEAFDNMPESFQSGERGEAMEEGLYNLEEIADTLEEQYNAIEELINA